MMATMLKQFTGASPDASSELENRQSDRKGNDGNEMRSMGVDLEKELEQQFLLFANFGNRSELAREMDGTRWMKYCTDCKLRGRALSASSVDLIFAKVKAKGSRRIDFHRFLRALSLVADKKDTSFVKIVLHCLAHRGPVTTATKADNIRLHDDKSTFTGVYARGGPTNVDRCNLDLSTITDRSAADARGVKLPPTPQHWSPAQQRLAMKGASREGSQPPGQSATRAPRLSTPRALAARQPYGSLTSPRASRPNGLGIDQLRGHSDDAPQSFAFELSPPTRASAETVAAAAPAATAATTPRAAPVWEGLDPVRNTFVAFACFGKSTPEGFDFTAAKLEGAAFAKLCRESGLVSSKLTVTRVDLIFAQMCDHRTKRMSYKRFVDALAKIAEVKCVELPRVAQAIATCAGPMLKGTIADGVRLHDDLRTYTGVYANGGPTSVDKHLCLEDMVDRQAEEHRQNKTHERRLRKSFSLPFR